MLQPVTGPCASQPYVLYFPSHTSSLVTPSSKVNQHPYSLTFVPLHLLFSMLRVPPFTLLPHVLLYLTHTLLYICLVFLDPHLPSFPMANLVGYLSSPHHLRTGNSA